MPASEKEPGYNLLLVATLDGETLTDALHVSTIQSGLVYPDTITQDGLIDRINKNIWDTDFEADLRKRWEIARDIHNVRDIFLVADKSSTDDTTGNNSDEVALARAATRLQGTVGSDAKVRSVMLDTDRRGEQSDFILACMNGRGLHGAFPVASELNHVVHHRVMTWPGMVAYTKNPGSNPQLEDEIARRTEMALNRGVTSSAAFGHDNCIEHVNPRTGKIVTIYTERAAILATAQMLQRSFDTSHAVLVQRREPKGQGFGSQAKLLRRHVPQGRAAHV